MASRPPPLSGTVDETESQTASFVGSQPDPGSTTAAEKRRNRLWSRLREETNTATVDERTTVERDIETDDNTQPLWKSLQRPDSTVDEDSMSRSLAPEPSNTCELVETDGKCHAMQQVTFAPQNHISEGTKLLMQRLEQETEEEIEYLEEVVETLTTERDTLRSSLARSQSHLDEARNTCNQWAESERALRSQNAELVAALKAERQRNEMLTQSLSDVTNNLGTRQAERGSLEEVAQQLLAAVRNELSTSSDSEAVKKEVEILRYENTKQRNELLKTLTEMKRLQADRKELPPTSEVTRGTQSLNGSSVLQSGSTSSSEWSTSSDEGSGDDRKEQRRHADPMA